MSVHSVSSDQEEDLEKGGAANAYHEPSWSPAKRRDAFESRMKVVRRIAIFTSLSYKLIWFLGVSALTWGSGVLLGAFVMNLSTGDFYGVSVLLFVEGIRFGMAGFVRKMRYKMAPWVRVLMLEGVQGLLAFAILITAIYSLLPDSIQIWARLHIFHMHHYSPALPDGRLRRALRIFYCLMLVNAGQVLLGGILTGLLRLWSVSANKSLHEYHDKLVGGSLTADSEVSDWIQGRYFSLQFAFRVLSDRYRSPSTSIHVSAFAKEGSGSGWTSARNKGEQAAAFRRAEVICKEYGDLICYMYMDKEGFHAAEVALEAEDVYVREAAANVVWFWAVLEDLVSESSGLQDHIKDRRPPICIQRGLLSKLANLATSNYNPAGFAATSALKVLLQSSRNPLELVMSVELMDMLIQYIKGLAQAHQHFIWVEESYVHVELLSHMLRRLEIESTTNPDLINKYTSVIPPPTSRGQQDQNLQALIDYVSNIFSVKNASSHHTLEIEPGLRKALMDSSQDTP